MLAIGAMAPRFTIFHINEIPPSSGEKYLGENETVCLPMVIGCASAQYRACFSLTDDIQGGVMGAPLA